ncbi:CHAT domain-containing protein [Algibacter mikhailovii]|uniref:CHAT domain-containing protein n=1 Tax=Algibacter mikhailovii TaxID=425498 RepID=UPI002494EE61|nr:CHAT domain-containing protein [Algibacter mikhailovii]
MTKKAKIIGVDRNVKSVNYVIPQTLKREFELKSYIEVSATRSSNTINTVELNDDDLVAIEFTDHTEWIGHPEDVQAIYEKKTQTKRSLSEDDYIFEIQISDENSSRGFIKRALVKVFSVFTPKKIAKVTMEALAMAYDKKIQPHPGLYKLDANFDKLEYESTSDVSKPFLLLLHGTLSTTKDAFFKLNQDNDTWGAMYNIYENRVLALEHYTLSVSPLKNALDFLNACPKACTLDILSHSRGGLIADILAKCDYNNPAPGFSEKEIGILKGKAEEENRALMVSINQVAAQKKIKINKVIRVAAPASGTTILSRRVDHFFNLLLNAASLAFGIANPLYHTVKAFLLELISQKDNPDVLPGLNAMMPESLFQKMMNISDDSVASDLYNISGDSDVGGINFSSLKVILANLFYRDDNDLVVDTRRMSHGVIRKNGIYKYLSKGRHSSHFNYFAANDSCPAILEALKADETNPVTLFTKESYAEGQRGILLDKLSLEGVMVLPEEITRDVVILIPGIMGSTLARNRENQWVDMRKMHNGGITKNLNISADNVEANGVIKKYYNDLANHLLEQYDVITLAFDWRKSLKEAALKLKQQLDEIIEKYKVNINIVAHSMGGLVVRQCMMDHSATWDLFKKNNSNKFIMLGTPWLGSYLIMEVLTGHSGRVKQLAAIDFENDRSDLLRVFWKFPGIFELLPIEKETDNAFWDSTFWEDLDAKANLKHMPKPSTNEKSLKGFSNYRTRVQTFLDNLNDGDFNNVFYICGQSDKTVYDYKLENRFFSRHKKLVYKATSYGDGSVTWATGIPKELIKNGNVYYTHTTHGQLANEAYIFDGISDLLSTGTTNRLNTEKPITRGGEIISDIYESPEPVFDSESVVNSIFNITQEIKAENEAFNVKVVHGDLRASSYPVMVGHFYMDLILSAEKALDEYLNNRLSQRKSIGYYPGAIGESEVFFNLKTQPRGAIICGLGSADALTSFLLSKSVKQAVLKYAMFMRDNYTLPKAKKYANGISLVLLGTGYGKLPVEDSIKGILLGIAQANQQISDTKEGLQSIKEVEIMNYYESVSSEAYFSLSRLQNADDRMPFILTKGITRRAGAKKRKMFHTTDYNWWYNLHIDSLIEQDENKVCSEDGVTGFKYYSSNGLARVEQEMVGIGLYKINHLLEEMSTNANWDRRLSKALFEMLVPNDFKNRFRNQDKLLLKLDKYAAQIPWELLHDSSSTEIPGSVTSGFIRQLVTEDAVNYNQVALNNIEALIVGDPLYNQNDLPPLPAAKDEAIWITNKLKLSGFNTNALINSTAKHIMMELFNKHYKIMHFAGHGIYDPDNCNVGIAIGNGICIDPAMINQIGYVPEFVFINCCFSGTLKAKDDVYHKQRYRLAANIGTQLIEMGVKAIVISGWAVDDGAAKVFAETFYERMFQGYIFGDAVQLARRDCHRKFPNTNTWGAYQCYGNQFYKFKSRSKLGHQEQEYVVASQVHTDLDNLLIAIRDKNKSKYDAEKELDALLKRAEIANLLDAGVLEKEALIYDELGMSEVANQKYEDLFLFDSGNYSIKALEQYCQVQFHKLKQDLVGLEGNNKTVIIQNYVANTELLMLAGENSSRLNIVANAYKQAANCIDDHSLKIDYLRKSFENYGKALMVSKDKYDGHYLNALSNMIYVGIFLEDLKDEALIQRITKNKLFKKLTNMEKFLNDFIKELDEFDKADLDISVLIGMTELRYALMLIKAKNVEESEWDILKRYGEIFKQLYSPRYINIEISQIEFFQQYVKNKKVLESLEHIKSELKKYLN